MNEVILIIILLVVLAVAITGIAMNIKEEEHIDIGKRKWERKRKH